MPGRCIAIDIVFPSVFSTRNPYLLANFYPLCIKYLKFYFLYFFNFSILFFPIDSSVKNKSMIGLLDALPGYFEDTAVKISYFWVNITDPPTGTKKFLSIL